MFFKIGIGYLIAVLKFAILFTFLLNGVVSQMNVLIIEIFKGELLTRCPQVPIFIPIAFDNPIHSRDQDKATDVEFSLIVKERVLEIFLNDKIGTTGPNCSS